MSVTFTKLFSSITESTVWCEPDSTRIVWITMLAMADRKGRVWGSIPGLANRARVTLEQCENALITFKSPDKYSRTPDNEGRRVEDIDGGWLLLNYEKHRAVQDDETIRESKRKWAERNRKSKKVEKVEVVGSELIQAEAEAEVNLKPSSSTVVDAPAGFDQFWSAYPKKVGKGAAMKLWARLKVNGNLTKVLSAIEQQKRSEQWQKDGGQFIPNPATWLGQSRWEDEVHSHVAVTQHASVGRVL